jgi:hypothetical protein
MSREFCSCEEIQIMFEQILEILRSAPPSGAPGAQISRKKRAPSEYNLAIKACMTGGEKSMKECATEYKQKKGM